MPAARKKTAPPASKAASPVVVAVAVGGVSFRSLERLFAHMPANTGAAFVVVSQQEGAIDPRRMLESLHSQSGMPAVLASEGVEVAADTIYVTPPSMLVTFEKGRLHARPSEEPLGERGTIDSFLQALAETNMDRAVAVLLQGLGMDGVAGVRALKELGGIALCEGEDEPERDGVTSTAASGICDLILPVGKLAERTASEARRLAAGPARSGDETDVSEHLGKIAGILRTRTGHDFHGYKQNTVVRRVQRRMHVLQIDDMAQYVDHLRTTPEESQHLFQDLLIGVTQFFRDEREFHLLEREVIPRLFENKGVGDQVRVWVLGCSTGEEAYSIAILLREHAATLDSPPSSQIFATDIDSRALAIARAGRYPQSIDKHLGPERMARWFSRQGDTYVVSKELREMCIFSAHNVLKDAPFSRVDLVSCRNLLIYLESQLQDRVIPLFHFALRPGGRLFLGPSENITRHQELFAPVDRRMRIFSRIDSGQRVLPPFPLGAGPARREPPPPPAPRNARINADVAKRAERLAERYAPAYVIIDEHNEIIHFAGRTGRYLDPASGSANLNLINMVNPDLRLELRGAIHRAIATDVPVKVEGLLMESDDGPRAVNILVERIGAAAEPLSLMVLFQDAPERVNAPVAPTGSLSELRDEHVERLEAELRLTRERLQSTTEEMESTNEELKSSNEEYQSINEEMQSATEELETSKEELQSINEELQTVNGELAHRVDELASANSDIKNLLESTQIATLFLDNELRIKSFTPAAAGVFNVIDTDHGRPIVHIAPRVTYPQLEEDARRVLRTLGAIEREVGDPQSGSRYLVRVLPYRSVDNFIAGVVLTFLDVTATAQAEQAMRQSEERFRRMTHTAPVFLFSAGPRMDLDYVNPRFYEYTGLAEGSALGDGWLAALHPDDVEENRAIFGEAAEGRQPIEQELRLRSRTGTYRWFLCRAEPVTDAEGVVVRWYGSCADIHPLRTAEKRQRLLLAELQHRVKNVLALVRSIATRTAASAQTIDEFTAHFEGRISALARSQSVLARRADMGVDLEELVRDELAAHGVNDDGALHLHGASIYLSAKAAETVGLALHELATNAVKYGFLSVDAGRLFVGWRTYDGPLGPRLALEWRESGVPILDPAPRRRGFGRDLIERGLPYELGASSVLEFAPGGARCVVELPLTDKVIIGGPDAASHRERPGNGDGRLDD